jgi:non-heme chloroperoxidase
VTKRLVALATCLCLSIGAPAAAAYRYVAGWGGAPLAVGEWGDPKAPGVLLIHGFGFSSAFWQPELRDRLARRFHIVAFDLRGHGASAKPWTPEAYAGSLPWSTDVEAVIKATGLDRPVIVGWSLGGYVAEDYVRDYGPKAVAGIVLVSSPAGFADHATPKHTAPGLGDVLLNQYSLDLATSLPAKEKLVALMSAHPLQREVAASWAAQELQLPPYVKAAMAGARFENKDLLVEQPTTLMLIGAEDETMPEAALRQIALAHPQMSMEVYPDSGHALSQDAPERFIADVAAFVDRVSTMPARPTMPLTLPTVAPAALQAHHVSLSVDDADRLAAWYIDTLGFKLTKRDAVLGGRIVWIDIPGFRIGLMQFPGSHRAVPLNQPVGSPPPQGYRGLFFSVPNVDTYAAYLQAKGVTLSSPPTSMTPPGIRIAYFKDPEGNLIGIYQDLDPSNALIPPIPASPR